MGGSQYHAARNFNFGGIKQAKVMQFAIHRPGDLKKVITCHR